MPEYIKVNISDLNIEIQYKEPKIAHLCRDYVADHSSADIKVNYDEKGCALEAKETGHSMLAAEFSNIHRQIAEKLPLFSRAVCHGAVVSYKQNGYMFIAKSGVGKTTHINLWRKYIKGTEIINGDKPILEVSRDRILAYGTPWSGKERLQKNTCVPLKGICLIKRANNNRIRELNSSEALSAIIKQIYMPENTEALDLTIKMIDDIIRLVPFYELSCNISREAAFCSFSAMTHESI